MRLIRGPLHTASKQAMKILLAPTLHQRQRQEDEREKTEEVEVEEDEDEEAQRLVKVADM